jgi:hypothetical protein
MSAATDRKHITGATVQTATTRDLAHKCQVRKFIGSYFLVTTEGAHTYRVECWFSGGDFHALCQCPVRAIRKRDCRHELAVVMHERNRVARQQFGD